jgi:hypothetical protein
MTHDDNIKFEMGVARKDDPRWAEAQILPFPDQSELWPEAKIWRVVHTPNWPEHPYQASHIPVHEDDLYRPVGVVYKNIGRYYVNVKTTHEGKALMIGKQLIKWGLEKCENK